MLADQPAGSTAVITGALLRIGLRPPSHFFACRRDRAMQIAARRSHHAVVADNSGAHDAAEAAAAAKDAPPQVPRPPRWG